MIKNTVALVTGAAGSLGSATAKRLVSAGCKVTMMDLPDSKGEEIAKELGDSAVFSPGDVTSEEDVKRALATAKRLGPLRTLVNCAGVHRTSPLYSFVQKAPSGMEKVEEVFNVNVKGMMNVTRFAVGAMAENKPDAMALRGVVINVSGFGAYDGQVGQAALAGAWGAISSMTLPLCRELGDIGIRVMTISPGLMESSLLSHLPTKIVKSLHALTPSPKRFGMREEFADLVVTIMENNFLNGEVIRLTGGLRVVL